MEKIPALHLNPEKSSQEPSAALPKEFSDSAGPPRESQSTRNLQRELLHRIISAQEEESRYIASILQNETRRLLTQIWNSLDANQHTILAGSNVTAMEIRNLTARALAGIGPIISELYPTMLDGQGLAAALSWYAERRFQGLRIDFNMREYGESSSTRPGVEIALFRIAQEALNNIARHSAAKHALCVLEFADACIKMRIADDGIGFDTMAVASGCNGTYSLGLLEMEERTHIIGGTFRLRSVPGEGTVIRVSVPLRRDESSQP